MTDHIWSNSYTGMEEIQRYWPVVALCFLSSAVLTSAWEQTSSQTVLKMQFSAAILPPTLLLYLSCRREERCELHQARLSQLEPLIITSQYQLQQPCTDAKTLRGLATLPYLIWAGGTETVLYHQPIQSEARTALHSASGSNRSTKQLKSHDLAT